MNQNNSWMIREAQESVDKKIFVSGYVIETKLNRYII